MGPGNAYVQVHVRGRDVRARTGCRHRRKDPRVGHVRQERQQRPAGPVDHAAHADSRRPRGDAALRRRPPVRGRAPRRDRLAPRRHRRARRSVRRPHPVRRADRRDGRRSLAAGPFAARPRLRAVLRVGSRANATLEASLATAGGGDAGRRGPLCCATAARRCSSAPPTSAAGATSWASWSVPVVGLEGARRDRLGADRHHARATKGTPGASSASRRSSPSSNRRHPRALSRAGWSCWSCWVAPRPVRSRHGADHAPGAFELTAVASSGGPRSSRTAPRARSRTPRSLRC